MSHEIVKSRGQPIASRAIAVQSVTPVPIVKSEIDLERIYARSVITFWLILFTCGAIGISAITIFGVVQLAKHSVEVAD